MQSKPPLCLATRTIKKFMSKKVRIPTPLRKLTNNEELIVINAAICF